MVSVGQIYEVPSVGMTLEVVSAEGPHFWGVRYSDGDIDTLNTKNFGGFRLKYHPPKRPTTKNA